MQTPNNKNARIRRIQAVLIVVFIVAVGAIVAMAFVNYELNDHNWAQVSSENYLALHPSSDNGSPLAFGIIAAAALFSFAWLEVAVNADRS